MRPLPKQRCPPPHDEGAYRQIGCEPHESAADDFSGMDGIENDPQALAKMMRKMGNEMGEELPSEFNDVVDRLEAGQSPEEIESALPDLGVGDTDAD